MILLTHQTQLQAIRIDAVIPVASTETINNHGQRNDRSAPCMDTVTGWGCHDLCLFVCLFMFYVPLTARSFRDGTPIHCPLRRTCSSVNTPFPPGIEPRVVTWQSITLPLRHASSTLCLQHGIHVLQHIGQSTTGAPAPPRHDLKCFKAV